MAATVVTSEPFEPVAAPAPAPAEAAQVAEPVVETNPGEQTEEEGEPQEKPETENARPRSDNPKIDKRFGELTAQRESARREAQAERERAERAEARAKELEAKVNPTPQEPEKTNAKPLPSQFNDAFEYAEALALWTAEDALDRREKEVAERQQIAERTKTVETWTKAREAVAARHDDFSDVVNNSTVNLSNAVSDAIIEMGEAGHEVLYHLAKNPELGEDIFKMSIPRQLREIGKLEAKLSAPTTEKATEKPVATPSGAPAPINPVRGTKAPDVKLTSDGNFHGTFAEYKKARLAGKIK